MLEAKPMTPMSTSRVPLKTLGITVQTSYMEGWTDKEISQKLKFYTLRPVTRKRREILGWAIKGDVYVILHIAEGTKRLFCCGAVLTVFWSPEVG